MGEKVIPQVILDVARDANHDLAHQEEKTPFQNCKEHNKRAVEQQLFLRDRFPKTVDGVLQEARGNDSGKV